MNSLSDILDKKADDLFSDENFDGYTSDDDKQDKDTDDNSQTDPDPLKEADKDKIKNEAEERKKVPNLDIAEVKNQIHKIKDQLDGLLRLLDGELVKRANFTNSDISNLPTGEKIIEGVFNGEKMVGSDAKEYSVPPNYASKSKLVEGDMMKLTITNNGSFVYKQIQPIERKRITGELVSDPSTGQCSVLTDGSTYKILTASVTFFKGKAGDEVVLLVPKDSESDWGAVENIISR